MNIAHKSDSGTLRFAWSSAMKEALCSDFLLGFSFSLFRHLSVIVLDDGNLSLVYRDMTAGIIVSRFAW
jgi:hypothetical protein